MSTCTHCQSHIGRRGAYCPHCGFATAVRTPGVPPGWRGHVRPGLRCGAFHHELLVHMFRFRYCTECGRPLSVPAMMPQLG